MNEDFPGSSSCRLPFVKEWPAPLIHCRSIVRTLWLTHWVRLSDYDTSSSWLSLYHIRNFLTLISTEARLGISFRDSKELIGKCLPQLKYLLGTFWHDAS